jgi:hypothetical protein
VFRDFYTPVSSIYVRHPGVTYYKIYIQCTALRNNSVLADEFEITPAWDDDITAISTEEEAYRVGEPLPLALPQSVKRFRNCGI